MAASPQFNVIQMTAPAALVGGLSALQPCQPGDKFTFAATLRYLSGPMQPRAYVNFLDPSYNPIGSTLTDAFAVLTNNGWHISTSCGNAPSGAAYAQIGTDCYFTGVSAVLTASVTSGSAQVAPSNNTNNMTVGQVVTVLDADNQNLNEAVVISALNPGAPGSFTASFTNSHPAGSVIVSGGSVAATIT